MSFMGLSGYVVVPQSGWFLITNLTKVEGYVAPYATLATAMLRNG